MSDVFCDIETQSLVDLREVGSRRYIVHPSTRLMCLVARHNNTNYAWLPSAPAVRTYDYEELTTGFAVPEWLRRFVTDDHPFIGHNAHNFDGPFLEHHYRLTPRWYDTMHAARASGLPGSLDAIGNALGFGGKDDDGKQVMRMLCSAKVKGGEVRYPVGTPALWEKLLRYNLQDVLITEQAYLQTKGREEVDVVRVHNRINDRGIKIDTTWLRDLLRLWNEIESTGGDRLAGLTGGELTRETAASVPKVKQWLAMQGVRIGSIARKELDVMFEDPETYFGEAPDVDLIVEVLLLRQQLTRAMKGKLERIASSLDDDHRVRGWAVYHGAHTGRWTARGLQPHNLSKGVNVDVEAIFKGPRTPADIHDRAIAKGCRVDDVLVSLVRPVFAAEMECTLGIVDYNAVEARGAAWLAGEQWMLDCFTDPKRDIYCEYWGKVTGKAITKKDPERQIAKICVLGLQYGMSHRKLGVYAKTAGIDLEAQGLTAEKLVADYRENCPAIVQMWRDVGDALKKGRRYGESSCCKGRVRFMGLGSDHLLCHLPSGRVLTYRNCRFLRGVPGYCAILGLPPFETDLLKYRNPKGFDADLYGTKCVENIVQAFCRDFLASALVQLDAEKFNPVLHVHDEIVCEFPKEHAKEDLDVLTYIMSKPPDWCLDFPLRVEGFTCDRYVKAPWSDSHKADWMRGVKL